ncbi:MAG: sigma-E factor negative regulatory protein, partial [Gammaproteobacteria bacterium]
MTEMTREQLSAFLDDELEEREADLLVRRLSTEADLRGAAVRYAVMGDVIRGDLLDGDPRTLLQRVSSSVASETAAPGAAAPWRAGVVLKALAGAAIAASV